MENFYEKCRRATTFLFAAFLWLHALFLLNSQSIFLSKYTQLITLTTSEIVLFGLLVVFSLLAASGFWKMLLSLAYIYFFPFVLLAYALYLCFCILRTMNRWFKTQEPSKQAALLVAGKEAPQIAPVFPPVSGGVAEAKKQPTGLLSFLLRPFRRFMMLWCVLLLVTTHLAVVWMCLIVVLVHLARRVLAILKILLLSEAWMAKIAEGILTGLNTVLVALGSVSREATRTNELEKLWNQVKLWRTVLDFLKDPYLLSRWAWVLGIVFLGSIYTYFAAIFSFAYYGIARVSGVAYSWPDALVASVFIPFFVSDLPKVLAVRLLGGIHCSLVVVIGIGTVLKFLRRKLDAIRNAAADLSNRFADQSVHEKYLILEEKCSTTSVSVPPRQNLGG